MAGNPWILPDHSQQNSQRMEQLYMWNMQQQRVAAVQQQRELARQAKATQFVGDNFKDANYATGTAADPIINQMTSDARTKFAKLIHDNPNMDEGDLEMQMQGEISKISQYSSAIKAGRKGIEEDAQHYQQMPGIDAGMLKQGAINRMLYQGGNKLVTDPNQIDLSKNYLNDELGANPDHYVIGEQPLTNAIDAFKPKVGGQTQINERAGVTTENEYNDKMYPWQSLKKDANGNAIGLQTSAVPATLSNGQAVVDPVTHQPMQVIDPQTAKLFATHGVQAQLKRDTDQYVKDNGYDPKDFPQGSEGYDILSRHILYNKLDKLTPSEFKQTTKKTNATFVDKMQAGVLDLLGRANTKAEEEKEQKLLNGNYGKLRQAVNLSPDALQGSLPYTDPSTGKQFLDVTSFVGGFGTDADKKPTSQYDPGFNQVQHLLVDPSNPGKLYTVEGQDGHIQEYDDKGVDAIMLRHASANGHSNLADVKNIISKIPIQPNLQVARQARAQLEFQKRQQQAKSPQNTLQNVLQPWAQTQ